MSKPPISPGSGRDFSGHESNLPTVNGSHFRRDDEQVTFHRILSAVATAAVLAPSVLQATDWTSIANGNWQTSGSWSPGGVPDLGPAGHTGTINHAITWVATDDTYIAGGNTLTVNTGGSFNRTGSNNNWIQIGNTSAGGNLVLDGGTFNGGNAATIVIGQGDGANATGTVNIKSGSLIAGTASGTSGSQYQMSNGNISVGMAKGSNAGTGVIHVGDGTGAAGTAILNLQTNNKELVLGTRSPWNSTSASGTGTVTIKSDGILQGGTADIRVGRQGSANTSSLTIESGGTANVRGALHVGQDSGSKGNLTLSGGTLTQTGSGGMWFGENSGSTGSLTMTGGSLTTQQFISIGESGTGSAALSGASTVAFSNTMAVGANNGSSGTMTLSDTASVSSADNTFINIGRNGGSTGSVTLNGSSSIALSHASASLSVGNSGNGTLTVNNSATVSVGSFIDVGRNSSSSGTIHQNGGTVTTGSVTFKSTGSNNAVYNLNGGTLAMNSFDVAGGSSTGRDLNLNGGTLKARSSTTSFLNASSGMDVNVKNGGATVDTNGNNITIAASLKQDGTGGLTKSGAGTLTLGGTNTYSGITTITSGTLALSSTGTIANTSTIDIRSGATFDTSAKSGGFTVGATQTLMGPGTVIGNTTIAGILSPGSSPGTMSFSNTLGLNGNAIMEIDGTAGAGLGMGHDLVSLTGLGAAGVLTYGGTLTLDLGAMFGAGSYSWNLFDFASESGTFATIALTDQYSGNLLDLNADGIWELTSDENTWQFNESTGVLGLDVVPEPSAALLGGLGILVLLRRRRA